MPSEILNLAFLPGTNAASQPLQISLLTWDVGRSPCRLPILSMSLAAASATSWSPHRDRRTEDSSSTALEALPLFELRLRERSDISRPHACDGVSYGVLHLFDGAVAINPDEYAPILVPLCKRRGLLVIRRKPDSNGRLVVVLQMNCLLYKTDADDAYLRVDL